MGGGCLDHKWRGNLQAGDTVVVHGASGGIGEAALRLGKLWGARTLAVVSLGGEGERRPGGWGRRGSSGRRVPRRVRELTDRRGVDIVVDPVGGDRFTDSLRSLAREGRLLVIGFIGGEIPTVKVNRLLLANTTVMGVAWGEFIFHYPAFLRQQADELLAAPADGSLHIPDGPQYPLAQAADVLTEMDGRPLIGKAVLIP